MSRWRPSVTSTASARRSWRSARARARSRAGRRCSPPAASTRCSCARRRCTMRRPRSPRFERGLAVYLEKPLARSLADGEAIVAAWQGSGTVCAVGYQWRSLDVVAQLRTLLRGTQPGLLVSRSFGPTEGARHDLEQGAAWFADPAISGGLLFELASHDIDLQIALAGPVESVQATAGEWPARARRPPAEPAWTTPSRCSCASPAAASAPATSPGAPSSPRRSTRSTSRRSDAALELVLDPVFELRGRARGTEVSLRGSEHPRLSTVTRFLDAARRGDPPRCPAPPPTRSPPCAPCWPASRQSRAASASRSRASARVRRLFACDCPAQPRPHAAASRRSESASERGTDKGVVEPIAPWQGLTPAAVRRQTPACRPAR